MALNPLTLIQPTESLSSPPASASGAEAVVTEVVEAPDPAMEAQVAYFLRHAPTEAGVCGEHDPRWLTVLRHGLGHRTFMLVARQDEPIVDPPGQPQRGAICGYLPLALLSTHLFGRFLVSLPYLNRAGIAAADRHVAAALVDHAVHLAERFNVRYLELRHHAATVQHEALGRQKDEKVRMVLDLPADSQFLWSNLDAKVRNQVRKGQKSGLSIEWDTIGLLDDFYDVFSVNMRDLGTPVYPRSLFAQILHHFGDEAEFAVVRKADRAVAAALLVHQDGLTQVPSASSLRRFNATNANMWMYYHLLVRAIERGSKAFDFGRSSVGSGTHRFKSQWGAVAQPTVWQYHERRGHADELRPDSPGYRRRIELWRKLPVWLTRLVGPCIVRGIP